MKDQKPKKQRGRRAYLDQFERTASGEYIYTGRHYVYDDPGRSRRSTLISLWIPSVLLAACVIAQGCLPAEGMMNCFYVLLPFLGEVFAAGCLIKDLIGLSAAAEPLREYIYKENVLPLPRLAAAALIFAAMTLIGEGLYLLTHGVHTPTATVILLPFIAASGLLALLIRRRTEHLPWKLQEDQAEQPVSQT